MEVEQIKSTLVGKLGQTGLSDRTISDYVNQNIPAEGTEPDDAYFDRHVAILKSINGQYSHDIATAIEEFKKNYKPEQQRQDPPQTKQDDEQIKSLLDRMKALEESQKNPAQDPQLKTLQDQMAKLLELNTRRDREQSVSQLISTLDGKVEAQKLVINDKNLWNLAVDMSKESIKPETTPDGLLEMVKAKYDELFKRLNPGSAKQPFGSSNPDQEESFVKEYLKKKLELEQKAVEARSKARETWK